MTLKGLYATSKGNTHKLLVNGSAGQYLVKEFVLTYGDNYRWQIPLDSDDQNILDRNDEYENLDVESQMRILDNSQYTDDNGQTWHLECIEADGSLFLIPDGLSFDDYVESKHDAVLYYDRDMGLDMAKVILHESAFNRDIEHNLNKFEHYSLSQDKISWSFFESWQAFLKKARYHYNGLTYYFYQDKHYALWIIPWGWNEELINL